MFITQPALEHVDNNHKPIGEKQQEHLADISGMLEKFSEISLSMIIENNYNRIPELVKMQEDILEMMDTYLMDQIKRLKKNKTGAKNTKLFMDLLAETKSLLFNMVNLTKSMRDLTKL